MNILIVGAGGVGFTLAERLTADGHQVTLVDTDQRRIDHCLDRLDVQALLGNGVSHKMLEEAGARTADLVLAVTSEDELNMLCCLVAKRGFGCRTIARVRNPLYFAELATIKDDLGLSLAINPELATANEIFDLIRIPAAVTAESFAKGRVNLIQLRIPDGSLLDGMSLVDFSEKLSRSTLVCIVEPRDRGEPFIPNGATVLHSGDSIHIMTPPEELNVLLRRIGYPVRHTGKVMIAGGGRIGFYLADRLQKNRSKVKIIEKDPKLCAELSEQLPNAEIICGDAIDRRLLSEEGLCSEDVFVSLTDMDEENILLSLYANKVSRAREITMVSTLGFTELTEELPLGSIVNPKEITANYILSYVRELNNTCNGTNIESLYYLCDRRIEALEFYINAESELTAAPLSRLELRKGILICCIYRDGKVIIPSGSDRICPGDSIVVVSPASSLRSARDLLR